MEKIYLTIIIAFVLYKIIPAILRVSSIYKTLGYKRIFISGIPFIIRKLTPIDFSDQQNGFPLTFFNMAKGQTMAEQMKALARSNDQQKALTKDELKNKLEIEKLICSKAVVYWPAGLKETDFFSLNVTPKAYNMALKLYYEIIAYNFPTLRKVYDFQRNYIIHVAELCEKFGKKPHEHISAKDCTVLEAYMIDEFFFNILLNEKLNPEIQKQNAMRKKGKK